MRALGLSFSLANPTPTFLPKSARCASTKCSRISTSVYFDHRPAFSLLSDSVIPPVSGSSLFDTYVLDTRHSTPRRLHRSPRPRSRSAHLITSPRPSTSTTYSTAPLLRHATRSLAPSHPFASSLALLSGVAERDLIARTRLCFWFTSSVPSTRGAYISLLLTA